LKDVLNSPEVQLRMADTKAAGEVLLLEKFWNTLGAQPDRAFYGIKHITVANEKQAIDTLLLTDSLFRSSDIATRKRYIALVEDVRANNGKVVIFSSMHVSGEQLEKISGVAAILRFPLPELEELDASDGEEEHNNHNHNYDRGNNGKKDEYDLGDLGSVGGESSTTSVN